VCDIWGIREIHTTFLFKTSKKKSLRRPRHSRWEGNIKMDIKTRGLKRCGPDLKCLI
jgi:hypothetical protein